MSYQEGTYQQGTYDSGSVIYDPLPSTVAEPVSPPANILPSASDIVPTATEGSVVVPGAEGASNRARPVVDPDAFVINAN